MTLWISRTLQISRPWLVTYKVVNGRITTRSVIITILRCTADEASMRVSSITCYWQRALIMSSIIKIFGYVQDS